MKCLVVLVIRNLTNPLTAQYMSLKSLINGKDFQWYYMPSTWFGSADIDIVDGKPKSPLSDQVHDDISFYSHKIMERPDRYSGRPFS